MAARTVAVGLIEYLSPDGHSLFGLHGQEVHVHDDDIERFDRLNVAMAPIPVPGVRDATTDELMVVDGLAGASQEPRSGDPVGAPTESGVEQRRQRRR